MPCGLSNTDHRIWKNNSYYYYIPRIHANSISHRATWIRFNTLKQVNFGGNAHMAARWCAAYITSCRQENTVRLPSAWLARSISVPPLPPWYQIATHVPSHGRHAITSEFPSQPSVRVLPDVISTEMGARVEARNPPLLIKKLSSQALDFTGYLWTTGPISVLPPNHTGPPPRSVANTSTRKGSPVPRVSLLGNKAR